MRSKQTKPAKPDDSPAIIHFVPNELCILFTHDRDERRQARPLVDLVPDLLRAALPDDPIAKTLNRESFLNKSAKPGDDNPYRVLTFQSQDNQSHSLLFASVGSARTPDDFRKFIQAAHGKVGGRDRQSGIRAITPNWCVAGAPSPMGTGGPGARPVPIPASEGPQTGGKRQRGRYKLPAPLEAARQSAQSGQLGLPGQAGQRPGMPPIQVEPPVRTPVVVVILDTAPAAALLKRAVTRLQGKHFLLDGMCALLPKSRKPRLQITYGHDLPPEGAANHYYIGNHDYPMPDHGLFVAGIVYDIAPNARLHLIQVLNRYGVGTVESIARGLLQALNEVTQHPSTPFVVNCSLMLDVPRPKFIPGELAGWSLLEDRQGNLDMAMPIEFICDELVRRNVSIVAAAGNEGVNNVHPPARYPAAFEDVVGVGALAAQQAPVLADYSNVSDDPARAGFATFGGAAVNGNADEVHGVLGVYIGDFPQPQLVNPAPRADGWARWAGTSFSTPVLSGCLALLRAQGKNAQDALQILQSAATQKVAITGEAILDVSQNP